MAMTEKGRELDAKAKLQASRLAYKTYTKFMRVLNEKHLTQRDICAKYGVEPQWLNTTLKSKNFTTSTLCKLSIMLDVPVSDFFTELPDMAF